MTELKSGIYKHYKGQLYTLLHIGFLESNQDEMAVYRSYGNNIVYVRPVFEFIDKFEYLEPDLAMQKREEVLVKILPNIKTGLEILSLSDSGTMRCEREGALKTLRQIKEWEALKSIKE